MVQQKVTKSFREAYSKLNTEQRAAVDTIDGPVMVVAGPGTGKTQTLAMRIANILLKTDTEPDAILALTFTESGARAMRERLVSLIGQDGYYVTISTFHSFCTQVIRDNPDFFTLDPGADPLSDLERIQIINALLDNRKLRALRPIGAPHYYTQAILSAISNLKREGIDRQEFGDILQKEQDFLVSAEEELSRTELNKRKRNLDKHLELAIIYEEYEKTLSDTQRFDFDDMVNVVTEALQKNEDLLLDYRERFLYFLVDEYQDTNSAQNELIQLLARPEPDANIFVVGDPDQSIYRFQGASIENQLSFISVYPAATVVTMKLNYRSTQEILDTADSLISHNNLRINDVVKSIDSHLDSVAGKGNKLNLAELSSSTAELVFLAENIKSKLAKGVQAKDISIIYRNNKESAAIADVLVRYGIDYSVEGGANVLDDPTVRNFITLLRVVDEMRRRQEDEDLFTILHFAIFHIDPLDVLKVARLAGSKRLTIFDVIADAELLNSLELETADKLQEALTLLAEFSELDANLTFTELFERVLNDSKYLEWILEQPDSHHRITKINTLFDEVKKMNRSNHNLDLKGFLANLDLMEENHLRLEENSYGKSEDAVTLTTAHRAKGQEWEHVYIVHATDGHWGNKVVRDKLKLPEGIIKNTDLSEKEKNEDERRLFYVALTRSKRNLTLTYANEYQQYGVNRATTPSMFMEELGDKLITKLDTTKIEQEAHTHLEKLLSTVDQPQVGKKEEAFLQELVDKFSLSATALNSYLECPYKFKLDKLLKVPHAKKPHLAFGTAVHAALEKFYQEYKNNSHLPRKEYLISAFEVALQKEVLNQKDEEVRLEEGRQILSAYYDFFFDDFREPLFLEKFFRVVLPVQPGSPAEASANEGITLTGKIDRIETLDPSDRTIRVVDYKTGKGKTMGQIQGTTKDSNGDLKRQLVFYRLLMDLDRRLRNITFGQAELDFVSEPFLKNKSGRHRLNITTEEVQELKKVISGVMAKIRNLEFPRTTDYKNCVDCDFRHHCWPEGLPTS